MDFTETLSALEGLIGERVGVYIGPRSQELPLNAVLTGELRVGKGFPTELLQQLEVPYDDVVAFMVGIEGEDPAWFTLNTHEFRRAELSHSGQVINIETRDLRIVVHHRVLDEFGSASTTLT